MSTELVSICCPAVALETGSSTTFSAFDSGAALASSLQMLSGVILSALNATPQQCNKVSVQTSANASLSIKDKYLIARQNTTLRSR